MNKGKIFKIAGISLAVLAIIGAVQDTSNDNDASSYYDKVGASEEDEEEAKKQSEIANKNFREEVKKEQEKDKYKGMNVKDLHMEVAKDIGFYNGVHKFLKNEDEFKELNYIITESMVMKKNDNIYAVENYIKSRGKALKEEKSLSLDTIYNIILDELEYAKWKDEPMSQEQKDMFTILLMDAKENKLRYRYQIFQHVQDTMNKLANN